MARIFFTLYAGIIAAVLLFWSSVIYLYGERDMIESHGKRIQKPHDN